MLSGSSGIPPVKFSFTTKFFYLGCDFKVKSYMEEKFGVAIGNYYVGYYTGDGWCAGWLNANGCLD
jgi:hypothetical protein